MSAGAGGTPLGGAAVDPDAGLLDRLAAGELEALGELYDRYRALAYAVALRVTNNMTTAEDVVQDAFMAIWRSASAFDARRGSTRTWLLTITHRRAVDAVRRRRPTSELPGGDGPLPTALTVDDAWQQVAARVDATAVRGALADLPPEQQQAIELAYFGGLTQQQIAERTDTPLGTVKGRMRLGLGALRRALADDARGAA